MVETLHFRLFGRFSVSTDGLDYKPLNAEKPATLIAYLALNENCEVDPVAQIFYESSEESRKSLNGLINKANGALKDLCASKKLFLSNDYSSGFVKFTCDIETDVKQFDRLYERILAEVGKTSPNETDLQDRLRQARQLYQDELLKGMGKLNWVGTARERYKEKFNRIQELCVEYRVPDNDIAGDIFQEDLPNIAPTPTPLPTLPLADEESRMALENPFTWRTGIRDANAFFGRRKELRQIRSRLNNSNCQLVGNRSIGKSSLMHQIVRDASEWYEGSVVSYIDLEDARCETVEGWLKLVCKGLDVEPVTTVIDFNEQIDAMLKDARRPIILMDKFEMFATRRASFNNDFFSNLRACANRGLAIATASRVPLSELTEKDAESSPFYNAFQILQIDRFTREEAEDFVTYSRDGIRPFAKDEKEAILAFALRHPLALQVTCSYILESENIETALQKSKVELLMKCPDGW